MDYSTYARLIYQYLTDNDFAGVLSSILSAVSDILVFVKYGLYFGCFVFFMYLIVTWLKPLLFKV